MRDPDNSKRQLNFLLLLSIGITLLFLWVIRDFVVTLVLAASLTAVARPFYCRLTRGLGGRRALASGVTVVLGFLIVVVPILLFCGLLVAQAVEVGRTAREWTTEVRENPQQLEERLQQYALFERLLPYQDRILEKAGQLSARAGSFVAEALAQVVSGTARMFLQLFVLLIALFTFLLRGRDAVLTCLRYLPLSEDDKRRLFGTFSSVGRAMIKGTLVVGIVQGTLGGLALWLAGIESAIFWGAVMTVASIIPGIGVALVWIPAVVYLALNGQIGAAIGVGLWCGLVVGTIDNVLRPLLVGKDTEMPDLLVLLTTLGGLATFGLAGLLLGPILGALLLTVWRLWGDAVEAWLRSPSPAA